MPAQGRSRLAVSTIHQALRRNGLVPPGRRRRVKAYKHFERAASNELWQIESTEFELADGRCACVFDCLDDHPRYLLCALACRSPSAEAAWRCFSHAAAAHGLPRQLLSDNHSCFTGRRHGVTVPFERRLARVGVRLLTSAPAHPQTLGKLERLHRTLKEWLAEQEVAGDLTDLQALLDGFKQHYNDERPHQAIGDQTPAERYRSGFQITERVRPHPVAVSEPTPDYPAAHDPAQGCGGTASPGTATWR